MTLQVSSYTTKFMVWYVPVPVTGTVSMVTGMVSELPTHGIPVRNTNYWGACSPIVSMGTRKA
jgi:hypothetical protein